MSKVASMSYAMLPSDHEVRVKFNFWHWGFGDISYILSPCKKRIILLVICFIDWWHGGSVALPNCSEIFLQTIVTELQEIITQAISRDEAALAIAQKVAMHFVSEGFY